MKLSDLVFSGILGRILILYMRACANDPHQRKDFGAARYAIYDGANGALILAAVGHYMNNQRQEFEPASAEESARDENKIERLEDDVLKADLSIEVSFDYNSADLKTAFYLTLKKLPTVIVKYDCTVVHVAGYTDSMVFPGIQPRLVRASSVIRYRQRWRAI